VDQALRHRNNAIRPLPIIPITDSADERLADYLNVPDPELLSRRGLFVAEGRLVVRRLLATPALAAQSVMVTTAALASLQDALEGAPQLPVYVVPQPVMDRVTGFNIHRGCLALGLRPQPHDWRVLTATARLVVVLERVGNADNIGSIFRSAQAFGVDAVLLGPACADPLYRKAIRTSMGAALALPFAEATPWPAALRDLASVGWHVVGLTPQSHEALGRFTSGSAPVAIVLGHEGEGLTVEALTACTTKLRIPINATVDSLNVATAAAIAFYELSRRST
jgi:tRNA G18 (ribose-2'-O)-methylase SpoU